VWLATQVLVPRFFNCQRNSQRNVEKPSQARFGVTYPIDTVAREEPAVRGITPYIDKNNYIVVTAPTGGDSIEDGPLKISSGGQWTGHAMFGSAGVGTGETYIIRVMATKAKLSIGAMINIPEDAVFSDPVTLRRKDR